MMKGNFSHNHYVFRENLHLFNDLVAQSIVLSLQKSSGLVINESKKSKCGTFFVKYSTTPPSSHFSTSSPIQTSINKHSIKFNICNTYFSTHDNQITTIPKFVIQSIRSSSRFSMFRLRQLMNIGHG